MKGVGAVRCPTPADLERAYWSHDETLSAHAEGCRACRAQWAEIAALAGLGQQIRLPPFSPERREELRTRVLSDEKVAPNTLRPAWRRWQIVPLAVAVAAVALFYWRPRDAASPRDGRRHSKVLAHEGASYMVAAQQPDEIIRLVEGTITIEVEALRQHERFRVITGDAEIEVRGTAFDVTSHRDRLVAVRTIHGAVEVRVTGLRSHVVVAGQTWTAPARTIDAAAPVAVATARPARRRALAPVPSRPADAAIAVPLPGVAQRAFEEGWAAIRNGSFDTAAAAFARVAAQNGDSRIVEDALFWRGVAIARSGRAVEAIRIFGTFLDAYPASVRAGEASAMVGWLFLERRDHAQAERHFRRALEDNAPRIRQSAADGLRALGPGKVQGEAGHP